MNHKENFPDWEMQLRLAVTFARRLMNNAMANMKNDQTFFCWFGTIDAAAFDKITSTLAAVHSRVLGGDVRWQCTSADEKDCHGDDGERFAAFVHESDHDVYLCHRFFDLAPRLGGETIIHEFAHLAGRRHDKDGKECYGPGAWGLPPEAALEHAENYSKYVLDLNTSGALVPNCRSDKPPDCR